MAEAFNTQYVAALLDTAKHEKLCKELAINFETLAVLNAEGKLLAAWREGSGHESEAVLKWLKSWPDLEKAVTNAQAAFKTKSDQDTRLALAKALDDAGRIAESSIHYEDAAKSLPKDDKRLLDVQLRRAEIALQMWDWEKAQTIQIEIFPKLLEAKDERAIAAAWGLVNKHSSDGDSKAAREVLIKVANAFPDNLDAQMCRISAAWMAHYAGDTATAKTELKAIIEQAKSNEALLESARHALKYIEDEEKENRDK